MPMPDDFERECLYHRDQWYLHDLPTLDPEKGLVVGVLDTHRIGPLVDAQMAWPGHPKHLPGAIAVQMTGTLGNLHAVYCMGLRPTEGWVGFGTHVHMAKFPHLGRIGPPVTARCQATRARQFRGTWFIDYDFLFEQEERPVYVSKQTAAWTRTEHRGLLP